jgi:glycerol-3-phosphate dehydrogenase
MEEAARWDIEMCSMMLSPSRNYKTGWRLSKGEALETIIDDFKTVEGVSTAKGLKDTLGEQFWELPLFSNLYLVLYEEKSLEQAVADILKSYLEKPLPQ